MVPSVLIVDDEKHTREGLQQALADSYDVSVAANADEAFNLMDAEEFAVIVTDLRMPGKSGLKVIDKALSLPYRPAVIMMTAYGNIETAVESMKRGAVDFLTKPVNIERLELLIQRAIKSKTLEVEVSRLHERLDEKFNFQHIIGHSQALKDVLDRVRLVAASKATILVEGESGTGKELIAQGIHQASPRSRGPFVAVHCAALSESLLESEVFGHERGAFTGAIERRVGRFESADGGTLFLDEIGEISASTQVKLLRFLETKSIERVGGSKPIELDVRLVAATNRNLERMVREGKFREDLFFRLNVVKLTMPPLRERAEDVPLLLAHFLKHFSTENGIAPLVIDPGAMRVLQAYSWPGNIRELRNFAENAVVLNRGGRLLEQDLDPKFRWAPALPMASSAQASAPSAAPAPASSPLAFPVETTLSVEENEKRLLREAPAEGAGHRTKAAELMGISRRTLHRKLASGLSWTRIESDPARSMTPRGNIQSLVHWLEAGRGGVWLRLAAVLAALATLSAIVAWKQFRGPADESVLMQADMARQLADGGGFSTLVNLPQSHALLKARGAAFDPASPFPELHHAPLYALVLAAPLKLLPQERRDALFAHLPEQPDGYGGDYYLLGVNVVLLWVAALQSYLLAKALFGRRAGIVASLALLFSAPFWSRVVLVDGVMLHAVLALGAFHVLLELERRREQDASKPWLPGAALLGLISGLLFLADYSAGAFLLVVLATLWLRFAGADRLRCLLLTLLCALAVAAPWLARNQAVSGNPLGLASQQFALKADDPTADPGAWRTSLLTQSPALDAQKIGNKVLTGMREDLTARLWSGGSLFLAAFFFAGLLYRFRSPQADVLRWLLAAALLVLMLAHAAFNSGESTRQPAVYLGPLVMVFGAGFFFVLVDSSPAVSAWPRLSAAVLLSLQALPLMHDMLEPRRVHFHYPPYFPTLYSGLRQELEQRGVAGRVGVMSDVPAGIAWYARQRTWAQPARLRDFYVIHLEQPIGDSCFPPRVLDRPFFSELGGRRVLPAPIAAESSRFGEWGIVYMGLVNNRFPADFPLRSPQRLAENLYVLVDPSLPSVQRGK